MFIRIDSSSGVPIWQQIVSQGIRQIVSGSILAGDRLPTVRELAGDLRINPNTVAKAYQELERSGYVETRRGLGTFVSDTTVREPDDTNRAALIDRIDALLVEAMQMRLDSAQLQLLIEDRMETMGLNKIAAAAPAGSAREEIKR